MEECNNSSWGRQAQRVSRQGINLASLRLRRQENEFKVHYSVSLLGFLASAGLIAYYLLTL